MFVQVNWRYMAMSKKSVQLVVTRIDDCVGYILAGIGQTGNVLCTKGNGRRCKNAKIKIGTLSAAGNQYLGVAGVAIPYHSPAFIKSGVGSCYVIVVNACG